MFYVVYHTLCMWVYEIGMEIAIDFIITILLALQYHSCVNHFMELQHA
jgi:hypothetical protein